MSPFNTGVTVTLSVLALYLCVIVFTIDAVHKNAVYLIGAPVWALQLVGLFFYIISTYKGNSSD